MNNQQLEKLRQLASQLQVPIETTIELTEKELSDITIPTNRGISKMTIKEIKKK